jgi:hypothetical protein
VPFDLDPSDPPSPLTVVRGILGAALLVATLIVLVDFFATGHLDPRFVGLLGTLWIFWLVFHDVLGVVLQPLAGWLGGQLVAGEDGGPALRIDIDQETAMLERLLADPPPVPHREILVGIRLAEIYRTHQRNQAKSDELLARLRAKYPNAPELHHGDGTA